MVDWTSMRHFQGIQGVTWPIFILDKKILATFLSKTKSFSHSKFSYCENLFPPERFIKRNFKDRCLFADIEKFVSNPKADLKKMRLVIWHFERKNPKISFLHLFDIFLGFWFVNLFAAFFAASCQAPSVQCLTHGKQCPRAPVVDDDMEEAGVDGPPCILFSQTLVLELVWFSFLVKPRKEF